MNNFDQLVTTACSHNHEVRAKLRPEEATIEIWTMPALADQHQSLVSYATEKTLATAASRLLGETQIDRRVIA